PLVTLALLRSMQAAGEAPGRFTRLAARGRVPFALAFSLCLLSAAPLTRLGLGRMQAAMSRVWRPDMRADWEAFARAMPDGAKVAAPWAATETFVFWAPRAAYLNVLDPLFMAARDAATYRLYLDLFEGREPDIPLLATSRLDSEFYADDGQYPFAKARLALDPRVAHLHDGITFLYRFLEGRNADFLLDWKVLPEGAPMPHPPGRGAGRVLRPRPRPRERAAVTPGPVRARESSRVPIGTQNGGGTGFAGHRSAESTLAIRPRASTARQPQRHSDVTFMGDC